MAPGELSHLLNSLPTFTDPNLLVGTETADDAGIYRLTDDIALVNTVDYFTPIVDDPYTFGAIAATNALSDVYSMGGVPKTALNITCWPKDTLDLEILGEIVRGGAAKVLEAGAVLVGGHTVDAPELMYGLAVTGIVHPHHFVKNYGAHPGDVLILTKKLGIGILTTGLKQNKISDAVLPPLVATMTRLNASASQIMRTHGATACTDITGYGLLGHASEMAQGNNAHLQIDSRAVPFFPEAPALIAQQVYTQAYLANTKFLADKVTFKPSLPEALHQLLMEAETSGGLLFALPAQNANAAIKALHATDCPEASIIGKVLHTDAPHIEVH